MPLIEINFARPEGTTNSTKGKYFGDRVVTKNHSQLQLSWLEQNFICLHFVDKHDKIKTLDKKSNLKLENPFVDAQLDAQQKLETEARIIKRHTQRSLYAA